MKFLLAALALAVALVAPARAGTLPRPAHVVIVIEENEAFWQILGEGAKNAPWLSATAKSGAIFPNAHGVTHPSQPNYLAMFAGVTNTNGDECPAVGFSRTAPNLASELLAAHLTFAAYSEDLPKAGFTGCWAGDTYGQKHAPWTQFTNVPQTLHRPFSALRSYDALPTVAFIVPNFIDDMHDAPSKTGDAWARAHLAPLVQWAQTHDTLVIFTWDEGYDNPNTIPLFMVGPMVKPGRYTARVDHYAVLRTLEDMYGLAPTGRAAQATPISAIWR